MKKWIFAMLVGGLIMGSATMAFADEEAPAAGRRFGRGKEFGQGKQMVQRMMKDGGRLQNGKEKLEGLFENYLPEEMDKFEALTESGKDLREDMKEWRDAIRETYEDEFEAVREEGQILVEEWKAKIESGEATREDMREAMQSFRQEAHDEILGLDAAKRAELDDIRDHLKEERADGKDIREALRDAVQAEDAEAIETLLGSILDEMETRLELHQQRFEMLQSI